MDSKRYSESRNQIREPCLWDLSGSYRQERTPGSGVAPQVRRLSVLPSSKVVLGPEIYHRGEAEQGGQSFHVPSTRMRWKPYDIQQIRNLYGTSQVVFDASRRHAFFHTFELDLTFSITDDAPEVSLWGLFPSRVDSFHLKYVRVQFGRITADTQQLLHTVEWTF